MILPCYRTSMSVHPITPTPPHASTTFTPLETSLPAVPKWLQRERKDAFEGHLNAYEVSLLCREAEETQGSSFPFLYETQGGGNHTIDDEVNQNTAQYLQVRRC